MSKSAFGEFFSVVISSAWSVTTSYYSWADSVKNRKIAIALMAVPPLIMFGLLSEPNSLQSSSGRIEPSEQVEPSPTVAPDNPLVLEDETAVEPTVELEPTAEPEPATIPEPVLSLSFTEEVAPTASRPSYSTCKDYNAAGYGNFSRSDLEYSSRRDRDGDGVACEF